MSKKHFGGCHCSSVRFSVAGEIDSVSICNCSICTKKGIIHWIVAPERFELLSGRDAIASYRFNTGAADHHFCRHCGIHSFYVPRSDPDKIDVNVRCLDDVDVDAVVKNIRHFDGKNWEAAFAARHGS